MWTPTSASEHLRVRQFCSPLLGPVMASSPPYSMVCSIVENTLLLVLPLVSMVGLWVPGPGPGALPCGFVLGTGPPSLWLGPGPMGPGALHFFFEIIAKKMKNAFPQLRGTHQVVPSGICTQRPLQNQ